jgi:acyl dehydratase
MTAQKIWWAEDFTPGLTFHTPGATLTEASIIQYAMLHDPQPFHTDVTAAEASLYGGLIASGFQTLTTAFRLWQGMGIINPASQGAPGMDELKWLAPVRPGDTIRAVVTVTSQRLSKSRPDIGIVGWRTEVFNQRGELVMSFAGPAMYLRRPENRGASGAQSLT